MALNETEWLSCPDPVRMLELLSNGAPSPRKLRLFAVACSRRAWEMIDDPGRKAVEVAERFADGQASDDELRAARLACKHAGGQAVWYAAATNPLIAARNTMLSIQSGAPSEASHQADLVRDIFGNPFRSISLDPWKTSEVMAIAQKIYNDRAFEQMPELADLLENAGCTDDETLSHCRKKTGHARGNQVIDLLLGKQ